MNFARSSPRAAKLLTAAVLLAVPVFAQTEKPQTEKQEGAEQEPVRPDGPQIEIPDLTGGQSDKDEMVRLFHEVEQTLESIDLELFDAGAGRIPVPDGKESGIERLLRSHGEKSDQAVSGIEEILALAQKMGGKSGSCMKQSMQGEPKQSGESPLDKERQRGPTKGENTPEAPKPEPGGEKPEPQPQGEKPDNRGPNPPPGENRPSPPRNDPSGPPVVPGTDGDRWGSLPERVQHVFQNQITDDLPLQYRDWIDSYYRRLNSSR